MRFLRSTGQQNYCVSILSEVDPVAGAVVLSQFRNSMPDGAVISEIALSDALETDVYLGKSRRVFQALHPFIEWVAGTGQKVNDVLWLRFHILYGPAGVYSIVNVFYSSHPSLAPLSGSCKSEIVFTVAQQQSEAPPSVAVVGVDVEAEDGVDFDRLLAAHGGAEFPGGECGHDFGGHGGGAGFEDLKIG